MICGQDHGHIIVSISDILERIEFGTASFKAFPGTNLATFFALILISFLVRKCQENVIKMRQKSFSIHQNRRPSDNYCRNVLMNQDVKPIFLSPLMENFFMA